MLCKLKDVSDKALVGKIKEIKGVENQAVADLVLYLSEFDSRKLYREMGYSSLFTYCTQALGYSESSAYRRIQAARLLKEMPEIYEKLRLGKLNLCTISEIARVKEQAAKAELLKSTEGMSKREVQALTVKHLPVKERQRETIKIKAVKALPELPLFTAPNDNDKPKEAVEELYTITLEASKELMELINEAKCLSGYKTNSSLIEKALKEYVLRRKAIIRKRAFTEKQSRFIPKSVKVDVRERDNNQCTYISPDGRRCTETHALEFDHVVPFAKGGVNSNDNIRLLCRAHNQLMAERAFGRRYAAPV